MSLSVGFRAAPRVGFRFMKLAIAAAPWRPPQPPLRWRRPADADVVAYLVNVHVRPGYNFPNADAAIGYGNTICDRVAAKMGYAQLVDQVKADFHTHGLLPGRLPDQPGRQRAVPRADLAAAAVRRRLHRSGLSLTHDNGGAPFGTPPLHRVSM